MEEDGNADSKTPWISNWIYALYVSLSLIIVFGVAMLAWADNMTVTQGSGTSLGTDTISSVHYQRMKIITGADNANDGDVSATNPMPVGGTGAAALGKAEDAVAASGDVGGMCLAIRRDTATSLTSASGDYTGLAANSFGALKSDVDYDFQSSTTKGLLKLEDVGFTSGDSGVPALGVYDSTPTSRVSADEDYSSLVTNAFGAQYMSIDSQWQASAATGLLKLEDSAHVSADAGVASWGVRRDNATSLSGLEGDYTPMAVNEMGAQHVVYDVDFQNGNTDKLLKIEDQASNNGDAGVAVFGTYSASPASIVGTGGDYTQFSCNIFGAQLISIDQQYQQNNAYGLLKLEDAAHGSGDAGVAALAVRNDDDSNVQTSANNDYSPISVDSRGRVSTNLNAVNAGGGSYQLGWFKEDAVHNDGDAGSQALFVRRNSATTLTSAEGDYASGVVNKYGAQRIDIQRDFQDNASGNEKEALLKAEDVAIVGGQAVVMAGAQRSDGSADLTDTNGDVTAIAADPAGRLKVIIEPGSGAGQVGVDIYRNLDLGTTGQVIKASAGKVHGFRLYNRATALRYVKFYDKATAPTGADTPIATLVLPAAASSSASVEAESLVIPWTHASGISVRATTGIADADTGAPSTNDVVVHVLYK